VIASHRSPSIDESLVCAYRIRRGYSLPQLDSLTDELKSNTHDCLHHRVLQQLPVGIGASNCRLLPLHTAPSGTAPSITLHLLNTKSSVHTGPLMPSTVAQF